MFIENDAMLVEISVRRIFSITIKIRISVRLVENLSAMNVGKINSVIKVAQLRTITLKEVKRST